jgi:polar amino acid transport system permease protein
MTEPRTADRPADIKAVPVRHPGRWVAALIILVLLAMLVNALFFAHAQRGSQRQKRFQWNIVGDYFTDSSILHGLLYTVEFTVLGMAIGILGGVLLAVMRLSANPLLSSVSWAYIWFFRGTPLLIQILFWFNISYLFPGRMAIGVPFGPAFFHFDTNTVITAYVAAVIALGTNEAAYMAEIVRAGILSVDDGQFEAAQSLGMTRPLALRRVVLPQAMRVIIPPTGNELISMLKNTSLASAISVGEITFAQQTISARTYQIVPLLLVAALWYLIVTTVLTIGQYYVERYYARGSSRALPPTPLQRIRTMLTTFHAPPPATTVVGGLGGGQHS